MSNVHLQPFGHSGYLDYSGGHCRGCGKQMQLHGKRDWKCFGCATAAYDEWKRVQDCPMICDADWPE